MKDISSVEASHSHLHLGKGIKLLQRYALLIDNDNLHMWTHFREINQTLSLWISLYPVKIHILSCKIIHKFFSSNLEKSRLS